jgi:hypothetical protein
MKIMMKCGHSANAKINVNGEYVQGCTFCSETEPAMKMPDLTNRIASCSMCNNKQPSTNYVNLAFFEFKGEGSSKGKIACKNCNYYESAHGLSHVPCKEFTPKGAFEFDEYYCGCRGWD